MLELVVDVLCSLTRSSSTCWSWSTTCCCSSTSWRWTCWNWSTMCFGCLMRCSRWMCWSCSTSSILAAGTEQTWLMVGGCPPPFSGGCSTAARGGGSKWSRVVSGAALHEDVVYRDRRGEVERVVLERVGPGDLGERERLPVHGERRCSLVCSAAQGVAVSTLISVVPGGHLGFCRWLRPGDRMIAVLPTRPDDRTPSPSATPARLLAYPRRHFLASQPSAAA